MSPNVLIIIIKDMSTEKVVGYFLWVVIAYCNGVELTIQLHI